MNIPLEAWGWLGGSIVAAIIVDFAVVRLVLEWLRPPSLYAFLVGRGAKLVALVAWIMFFTSYWYPQYIGHGLGIPDTLRWIMIGLVVGLLALAAVTLPRAPRGEHDA